MFLRVYTFPGYGKFNYLLMLLMFPASCSSTYDATSLSYALPTATCDLKLDAYDRGYLNAVIYAGMISSAFLWGFVSDKFGRQKILMFGYLGDVVFAVAASLSQNFWSLLIFRFFSGFMICGPFSILMSYLSELFKSDRRDSVIMMVGLFQSIGGILQPFIALAIIPQTIHWSLLDGLLVINSWRLFLLVCTLPSLIAGIGTAFCYESPRFLLAKGRKDEALRVFRSIYSVNTGKPACTYSVKKLKSDPVAANEPKESSWWQEMTALFRPPYFHKSVLLFIIQFNCLLTMNTIKLWLPQLFFYIKEMQGEGSFTTCEILAANRTSSKVTDCENFTVDTSVYFNMLVASVLLAISFSISTVAVNYVGTKNLMG
ncbi:hypothetical protein J6590_041192 [Homalodisca vitripennis]|nr:hypothetical protein J6590_041192 [Homalodisca vitripennis]